MGNFGIGTPYFYEMELGLIECIKMIYDNDTDYIILQDSRFNSLDDIVISKNGQLINVQVKHTDVNNNFNYSFFWGSNEKTDSLLKSLALDWKNNQNYNIKEISIYSNKHFGENETKKYISFSKFVKETLVKIKSNYDMETSSLCEKERNTINEFKRRLEIYLTKEESSKFVKLLCFYTTPSLEQVINLLKKDIENVIGTNNPDSVEKAFDSLQSKLHIWNTSLRKKEIITKEDVYEALCEKYDDGVYDCYPEEPIFPSRIDFSKKIEKCINELNDSYFYIYGAPGIGKTNLVSYLFTKENTIVDFRFYTYYPAAKVKYNYSDDYGNYSGKDLWLSILKQLRSKFASMNCLYNVNFPLVYSFLETYRLKDLALKYLKVYYDMVGHCVVFIDGIDHAARANESWNKTYLSELPNPNELSEGIKFVIVGQPNYNQYPAFIKNNEIKKVELTGMTEEDIILAIENRIKIDIAPDTLAKGILRTIGNNTLNVMFAIMELIKFDNNNSLDDIIEYLETKQLNNEINNYYNWIYNSFERNTLLKQIILIFAFISSKVSVDDLISITGKTKIEMVELMDKLYPLIIYHDGLYFVYHNDARLFFRAKIISEKFYNELVESIIPMLENCKKVKHEILLQILKYSNLNLFDYYDLNYLSEYFVNGISSRIVKNDLIIATNYLLKNKRIEKIYILNLMAQSLYQQDYFIRYNNEDESELYEKNWYESEKYCFNVLDDEDIAIIVGDIYSLLNSNEESRATQLYLRYFKKMDSYKIYCLVNENSKKYDLLKKIGFIMRTFYKEDVHLINKPDIPFFEGWFDAINEKNINIKIDFIFFHKEYYSDFVNDYVHKIMRYDSNNKQEQLILEISNHYKLTLETYICIYEKYESRFAFEYIKNNTSELSSGKSDHDDILLFYRYLKCVGYINDYEQYDEIYNKIIADNRCGEGERGFKLAHELYDIFKTVTNHIYNISKIPKNKFKEFFLNALFLERRYGSGTAYDCNCHSVLPIIYDLIARICLDDEEYSIILCDEYLKSEQYTERALVWEFEEIFKKYNYSLQYYDILKKWFNYENGYLWKCSADVIINVGNKIVCSLLNFGFEKDAELLSRKIKYRERIGYVDHKDYSFYDLIEWYNCIPDSVDKNKKYDASILSLCEYASNTGDNRGKEITYDSILSSALVCGGHCFDAVYRMNNNPKMFFYWRQRAAFVINDYLKNRTDIDLLELLNKWDISLSNDVSANYNDKFDISFLLNSAYDVYKYNIADYLNDEKNYSKPDYLMEVFNNICDIDKIKLYRDYIRPYIINRSKYGWYYDGSSTLIKAVANLISIDDFYLLIKVVFDSYNESEPYNIKDDLNTIALAYCKKFDYENCSNVLEMFINMHKTWIGIPYFEYEYLEDSNVITMKDFVNKMLMK